MYQTGEPISYKGIQIHYVDCCDYCATINGKTYFGDPDYLFEEIDNYVASLDTINQIHSAVNDTNII